MARLATVSVLGLIFVLATRCAASDGWATPPLPRIVVSSDHKSFVPEGSNQRFVPWGFNYLGEFGKLAEDDWQTPAGWERIEKDFREMRKLGTNVVRWHLQFETFMKSPDEVKAEELGRLKKLLRVARDNQLYLDLTGLNCFRKDRIPAWYDVLSEQDRWKTQARFWDAVSATCAGDSTVFCYNLMNEPVVAAAKKGEHPWVTGELGGFCFVQRICDSSERRDAKEIAEAWVRTLTTPIRKNDPHALITVGDIPWSMVFPGAKPVFYCPQVARYLDFTAVHFYPATGKLDAELKALAAYQVGKPLVIEEIYPLNCSLDDLNKFIDAVSPQTAGWIAHYFGHTPAEHRQGAAPATAPAADFLEYWQKKGAVISSGPHQ